MPLTRSSATTSNFIAWPKASRRKLWASSSALPSSKYKKYEKGAYRVGSGRLFRVAAILRVKVTVLFDYALAPEAAGEQVPPLHGVGGSIPPLGIIVPLLSQGFLPF